jgi:Tfp pilus assembly protein PilE
MGQQQLLLVILVTIIVGIATVVAINTFGAAADSANVDAVRQDLLSMASAAQGYYMRPAMLGGGAREFTGIEWNNLGSVPGTVTNDVLANDNGDYEFGTIEADNFIIEASPASGGGIQIRVCPDNAVMGDYDPAAANGGAADAPDACP